MSVIIENSTNVYYNSKSNSYKKLFSISWFTYIIPKIKDLTKICVNSFFLNFNFLDDK